MPICFLSGLPYRNSISRGSYHVVTYARWRGFIRRKSKPRSNILFGVIMLDGQGSISVLPLVFHLSHAWLMWLRSYRYRMNWPAYIRLRKWHLLTQSCSYISASFFSLYCIHSRRTNGHLHCMRCVPIHSEMCIPLSVRRHSTHANFGPP
jgi:hypothetical protein